jgi:hypothetical protein
MQPEPTWTVEAGVVSQHTDATTIANQAETIERLIAERDEARKEIADNDYEFTTVHRQASQHIEEQAAELAELRALIAPFGDGLTEARWMDEFDAMTACRAYNRQRQATR